ncbi:MAG: hypothetical protein ACC645_23740 [Pirellulales bacterium]
MPKLHQPRHSVPWPLLLAAILTAGTAFSATVRIDDDRMLVVDGKRRFVVGLYENPKDDTVLRQVADAGFNLVRSAASRSALDRLERHGLHGWVNTGSAIDLSKQQETRTAQLKQLVDRTGNHPAMLLWEVPDEALWNCWYRAFQWQHGQEPTQQLQQIKALSDHQQSEKLKQMHAEARSHLEVADYVTYERIADQIWRDLGSAQPHPELRLSTAPERAAKMSDGMLKGYTLLNRLDASHPIWMNHAPRNSIAQLARFDRAADIVGCDIYPVPPYVGGHSDLTDRSLSAVGQYTRRMQEAAPEKPVFMVLQGFGWTDIGQKKDNPAAGRRPTFRETRFMAYDAIVRGSRGILYWGTHSIEKDSSLWSDLLKLSRELTDLKDVLAARDVVPPLKIELAAETWGSLDRGVLVLGKAHNGHTWLIVVNEWNEPLRYRIAGLPDSGKQPYINVHTKAAVPVDSGALTGTIRGQGVQVLAPVP